MSENLHRSRCMKAAAFEIEKLQVAEEAAHQLCLQRIAERAIASSRLNEEQERRRRWELVRDLVGDEEQGRDAIFRREQDAFEGLTDAFFRILADPLFDLQVDERLEREEHLEVLEREAFTALVVRSVSELESVFRRRLQRAHMSLTSSLLSVPIMLFNTECKIRLLERDKRRQLCVTREIEHGVLWERFVTDINPLIDRELWRFECLEASTRMVIEKTELEDSAAAFHGCQSSFELVARYTQVVRETNARRAQMKAEAIADILEDELAERTLLTRDQREGWILIAEIQRRDVDAIHSAIKKKQIAEAMKAAEGLRQAEIQQLAIEEEKRKRERERVNDERQQQQRKTSGSRGATPTVASKAVPAGVGAKSSRSSTTNAPIKSTSK